MFSLDVDAKALTKSYRCQPTSSLTACANWIYDVSVATPSHGISLRVFRPPGPRRPQASLILRGQDSVRLALKSVGIIDVKGRGADRYVRDERVVAVHLRNTTARK